MLLVGQEIRGQGQTTPGHHGPETLLAEGPDETREGHGRERGEHRAPLPTEPARRRSSGIASDLGAPRAVAQDDVREHGEYRLARRALEAPDGEPTPPDRRRMRMAREASAPTTGGLVVQLQAQGQDEGEATFEERLASAKALKVSRFGLKIAGDGPVFACGFGRCAHVFPLCHQVSQAEATPWGEHVAIARQS